MGLQEIKKAIHETPIEVILEKAIELTNVSGRLTAPCPFHHGDKLNQMYVGGKQNTYRCFLCCPKGASSQDVGAGDAIKFYMDFYHLGFKDAVLKIGLDMEWINDDEANQLGRKNAGNSLSLNIKTSKIKKIEKKEKANNAILDEIYKVFSESLSLVGKKKLSKVHYKYLIDRGISPKTIVDGGYFTMPKTSEIKKAFLKELDDLGINKYNLYKTPGFYCLDTDNSKDFKENLTWDYIKGIGMPLKNAKGQIVGIQIRKSELKNSKQNRYIWFSSSKYEKTDSNKIGYGTSAGTPIGVLIPKQKEKSTVLFITEGRIKAETLVNKYNQVALTVQGVGIYQDVISQIKILEKKGYKFKRYIIAYDADLSKNPIVAKHSIGLYDLLKKSIEDEKIKKARIQHLLWNYKIEKGIDDMINSQRDDEIIAINSLRFKKEYLYILEKFENKFGEKPSNKEDKKKWLNKLHKVFISSFIENEED